MERSSRRNISHSAVGYYAYATQGHKNVCVNVAYVGSEAGELITVLDDEYSWLRNIRHVIKPVQPVVIALPFHGRLGCPYADRGCIANHRRKIFKDAVDTGVGKTLIPQPYVESFDSIRHSTRVQLPQLLKLRGRELFHLR